MALTYLSPGMLAERLPYSERHIREYLKDRIFIEGYHYVRAPGGRRLLFIWERVEELLGGTGSPMPSIPLASGGVVHG